jgi:hypothetical protein
MAFVTGKLKTVLRLEGFCILLVSVLFFRQISSDWGLFAGLFLVPDLAFLGYLVNSTGTTIRKEQLFERNNEALIPTFVVQHSTLCNKTLFTSVTNLTSGIFQLAIMRHPQDIH